MATVVATAALVGLPSAPADAQVVPSPNPPIADSCGIDVTLVLDASGSIQSANAVEAVRDAGDAFLSALADTNSTARVLDFGTVARQTAPSALVTAASLSSGGAFRSALNAYYNPKPPILPPTQAREYKGGNPLLAGSYAAPSLSTEYTNWDQALDRAGEQPSKLLVFVTDGDPTAFDFTEPGDPFNPGQVPPNVAFRTDRTSAAAAITLDRAIVEANQAKANGTRVLAVGVGEAVTGNVGSRNRLIAVSGPNVATTAAAFDIKTTDVALVRDFEELAQSLRNVVVQLCSPSLTITKLAQSPGDAGYAPAPDWDMTVTPTVTGGTFEWILPDTSTATSKTVSTNDNGVAQFQWEPDPPTLSSSATVSEAVQPEYTPETYRCERRNPDGTVDVSSGPLTGSPPTFTITVGPEQIVTCALLNSFNYAPAIQVTKVNSPTEVRGDLTPPAEVTSSYAVTNPGNTPLSQLELTDDLCGLVDPVLSGAVNVGDTNADGRLDVTETWQFTCVREIQQSLITTPLSVTNTVTATGVDPEGSLVSDTATDDVEIITPAVTLAKLVGAPTAPPIPPAEEITVTSGTTVTYSYSVTNAGNVPLTDIALEDDTPPCEGPIFDGGDANDDGALDLTETWTYTCQSTVTQSVINTATVTGTPTRPTADPGPPVEATDAASVLTVTPDLVLTKEVDQDLVLPGTEVTYTFVAHNTGTADLRDPLDSPDDPPVPPDGWIEDDQCEPVTFVSGDVDGDGILNGSAGGAAETWTFTCSATIDVETLNEATIEAVTVAPAPVTLERSAPAIVRVVEPEIAVTKTALRGVVLDPAADAQSGPDVPDPREAVYLYEVSNLGSLPLADVEDRIDDDTCSPVSYDAGDTNADELLDLDEVWVFSCSDQLEKADGFPPDEPISSLVTNTVTAVGVPVLNDVEQPDFEVEDTDIAQVLVILPELTLTKTASASLVRPNTDVTYTYVAQNTGDVGLDPVAITDDRCAPVTLADGDNGNGLIDGANTATAETWTFTCTTNVGFPDPLDPVTNNAVISVLDPLGNTYVRDASATVALFDPGIDLDKTVSSELVPIGSTVTYDFTVTNAGDSPVEANDVLAGVTLNDASLPANPGCASPTFVGGDTNGNGAMERPETWTYQCTGVITQDTVDLAAVFGIDIQGTPIAALDAAYTGPFTPQIAVTKTAIPTSLMAGGGPVTYTYAVTNPGDVPLADVAGRFSDDTCSPATFVTGDVDGDGLLDTVNDRFEQPEDETWIFTCTTNVTDDTLNTVVVEGTPTFPDGELLCPQSPCDVRATAQATVGVVDLGSITIVKSASPKGSTTFGFTGSLGDFRLVGDGSSAGRRTVTGLTPGTYAVREVVPSGWRLDALTCADPMGGSTTAVADATATIGLAEGEAVTCTFVNKRNAGPPLPETGFGVGPPLRVALALILAGALLVAWSSLRRRGLAEA